MIGSTIRISISNGSDQDGHVLKTQNLIARVATKSLGQVCRQRDHFFLRRSHEWCAHPPRPLRASTETRRRMRRAPRVRKTSPRSSARAIRAPNRPIATQNGRGGKVNLNILSKYFVRRLRDRTVSFASRAPLRAFFACFLAAARDPAMTTRRARFPRVEIAGGAKRRIAFPSGRVTSTPRPNPSGSILIPNRIIHPNSSVSPPRHLTPRQVSQDEAKK